jgi:chemotaxis protein histidine kinase CheA
MIDLSLLEDFTSGAGESLDEMEAALLELETDTHNTELLHTIFRAMHTIKGAAQFVGLEKVSALSHVLEDLLDLLRNGKKQVNPEIIDLLIQAKDRIGLLSNDLERTQTEITDVDDLIVEIKVHLNPDEAESVIEAIPQPEAVSSTVETGDESLEALFADDVEGNDLSGFLTDEDMSSFLADTDSGEELLSFVEDDNTITNFLSESLSEPDVVEAEDEQDAQQLADAEISAFLTDGLPVEKSVKTQEPVFAAKPSDDKAAVFSSIEEDDTEADIRAFLAEAVVTPPLPAEVRHDFETHLSITPHVQSDDFILPDEEYDQELFGIFIDQLKQKLALFEQTVIKPLKLNNHQASLLENAIEILESLKFSANYMAYESLTRFYANWIKAIVDTQKEIAAGNSVSYEFIQLYMQRLRNFFPQLSNTFTESPKEKPSEKSADKKNLSDRSSSRRVHESPPKPAVEKPQLIEKSPAVKSSVVQTQAKANLAASIDHLVDVDDDQSNSAFINDLINQKDTEIKAKAAPATRSFAAEPPLVKSAVQVLPVEETPVNEDEDDLFKRLSSALDFSIEQSIVSEPINEIFGALLASTKEEQSKNKTLKDSGIKLEVKTLAQANSEPEPKPFTVVSPKAETSPATPVADIKPTPRTVPPTKAKAASQPAVAPVTVPAKSESVVTAKTESSVELPKVETPLKKAKPEAANAEKIFKKSIRVDADKIDSLMNQVGELIVDRAYFFQLATEIKDLQGYLKEVTGLGQKDLKPVRTFAYRFSEAIISLGRTSNELQEGVMKIRMLPIAQIFNRYPRLVHDVAHTNGKKVQLEIRGEETELDKMIIEEISDPLIHMIRNAIGHGIEPPEMRKKVGKPEVGTLVLEAYHESNHIVIEVTDDGKGIDTERIKTKAEEMNLFTREELNRMSKDEITRFIMMPGFSTAPEINSTSGRGVGMDVVKKNIEKLNGTIEVESKFGFETKMRLKIPLTLAIIPALLIRVGSDSFTIPLANVEETLRVAEHEISIMEEVEVMYLRGKTLPIFRLAALFGLNSTQDVGETDFFVVVVNTGNQRVGLMVDALLGQEEVVIKPLADYLQDKNCFSGATIIGDGRISLILDVYELINMTTNKQVKRHHDQENKSLAFFQGRNLS